MKPLRMLVIPAECHPTDHSFLEEVHTRDASRVARTFFMRSEAVSAPERRRWNEADLELIPLRSSSRLLAGIAVYFLDLRYLWHLTRLARRERPHVLFIRDLTFPLLFALALRPWLRWRVVFQRSFPHEHGWFDPQRVQKYRSPGLYRFARRVELHLLRLLLGQADAVIPISDRMAEELVTEGVCERARVHAFGMGVTHDVVGAGFPPVREPGTELRLIYVGTLVARRGIERLLEAVGLAHSEHGVDARLTVYGGTPDEVQALRLRADALGLGDRVSIRGQIARSRVYREMTLHHAGAIFVGRDPRFRVASTTKLIESLAVGLPCIATDAVAMHGDYVRQGEAVLLSDDTAAGFAAAIARLEAEWSSIAERALARRESVYRANSYEGARASMEDLIVRLVAGGNEIS